MSKNSVYNEHKFVAKMALWKEYFVVLGSFIFLCITLYLDYTAYKTKNKYNSIVGEINSSTCKGNGQKYDCSLNILYKIENKEYQNELLTIYTNKYKPDDSINIRYNKKNKNKIILEEETFMGFSIFGILCFIGALINLFIIMHIYNKNFN
jgi:hypothetical protein